jgi:hypothetical protein
MAARNLLFFRPNYDDEKRTEKPSTLFTHVSVAKIAEFLTGFEDNTVDDPQYGKCKYMVEMVNDASMTRAHADAFVAKNREQCQQNNGNPHRRPRSILQQ